MFVVDLNLRNSLVNESENLFLLLLGQLHLRLVEYLQIESVLLYDLLFVLAVPILFEALVDNLVRGSLALVVQKIGEGQQAGGGQRPPLAARHYELVGVVECVFKLAEVADRLEFRALSDCDVELVGELAHVLFELLEFLY